MIYAADETRTPELLLKDMSITDANGDRINEYTIKLNTLGDRDMSVLLPSTRMDVNQGRAAEYYNFFDGDEIDVFWRGVNASGEEVSWSQAIKVLNRDPSNAYEFYVPSGKVKPLVGSTAQLSYRVTQGPNSPAPGKTFNAPLLEIAITGLILPAPQVEGVVGDTLDPVKFKGVVGNRYATVLVDYPGMARGDIVEVYRNGLAVEDIPISDSNVMRRPLKFEWKESELSGASSDVITIYYVVYRGQPEEAYTSNAITLRIGVSLAALPPFITEVTAGRLEPGSYIDKVFVHIPPEATLVNDIVTLYWVGAGEAGSLRDRALVTTRNDSGDLKFDIYEDVIAPNRRRLVKVYYTLSRLVNGRTVVLRSPDLMFFVGTEQEQADFATSGGLGPIEVTGASNGVLDTPAGTEAKIVVPFAATYVNDEVSVYWRVKGEQDSQLLGTQAVTAENVDSDLVFTAPASLVGGSLNKSIELFYVIKRLGDPDPIYIESPYKVIRVGPLTGDQLLPPAVDGVADDGTLDPMHVLNGAKVVVPAYPGMAIGDKIVVTWDGGPGPGTARLAVVTVSRLGPLTVDVPAVAVAYSVDYSVLVSYEVTRVGQTAPLYSPSRVIEVFGFYDEELTRPRIVQAPNGVLDLSTATDPVTVIIDKWPLIAAGQRMWLRLEGVAADNSSLVITVAIAKSLSDADVQKAVSFAIAKSEFANLKNGGRLKVNFKVAWDGDVDESEARLFPFFEVEIRQPGIKPGEALSIDARDMNLGGYFVVINAAYLANPPSKSSAIRTATGGRPPYHYSSSNPAVAQVDSATGKVNARGNGIAVIVAMDQNGATVSYRVLVTGVYALEQVPMMFHTYGVCRKSAETKGLRIPTLQEWQTMKRMSGGQMNLPYVEEQGQTRYKRVWTQDVVLFHRISFYPDEDRTVKLIDTSIIIPGSDAPILNAGETAHGFGIRS
ncbi:hypothetical protein [Pseudomonas caspiana]|uniref:BIG2 domain-containing protein n=1 Tax=Pseudomonas caspiana TaxID=1451454 RepID=A0A1Y3NXV9_9PSED|nr:hypothetical protein [Pseudomonas caspiana]OUM71031.1 hypothetical protein AUC60_25305 [Pseudomonas caspiana]